MDLGAFLSRTQWFKALPKNKTTQVIHRLLFSHRKEMSTEMQLIAACGIGRSLKSHLSTLQVPPHGSFATYGQASVVQHSQKKQHQAENQASRAT